MVERHVLVCTLWEVDEGREAGKPDPVDERVEGGGLHLRVVHGMEVAPSLLAKGGEGGDSTLLLQPHAVMAGRAGDEDEDWLSLPGCLVSERVEESHRGFVSALSVRDPKKKKGRQGLLFPFSLSLSFSLFLSPSYKVRTGRWRREGTQFAYEETILRRERERTRA